MGREKKGHDVSKNIAPLMNPDIVTERQKGKRRSLYNGYPNIQSSDCCQECMRNHVYCTHNYPSVVSSSSTEQTTFRYDATTFGLPCGRFKRLKATHTSHVNVQSQQPVSITDGSQYRKRPLLQNVSPQSCYPSTVSAGPVTTSVSNPALKRRFYGHTSTTQAKNLSTLRQASSDGHTPDAYENVGCHVDSRRLEAPALCAHSLTANSQVSAGTPTYVVPLSQTSACLDPDADTFLTPASEERVADVNHGADMPNTLSIQPVTECFYAPSDYIDIGDCTLECSYCAAFFWYEERLKDNNKYPSPVYHGCCSGGKVSLPPENEPPSMFKDLLCQRHFVDNIRAYNQMFAMTSFGANIDDTINNGRAPYVFKVSGQIYHWIGSLCPLDGNPPRFLQLYIHDTHNEVTNRLTHFITSGRDEGLKTTVVESLIGLLDSHNELIRLFRTAREKYTSQDIPDFKIRLFSVPGLRDYDLPTSDALGVIVFDSEPLASTDYDVIIDLKGGRPQRINKLHPCYMALQFPLLFIYGQQGYYPTLKMKTSVSGNETKRLSMNAYYTYQLHERSHHYNLLFRSGRLFQQYIVSVYCCIEQNRMDFLRANQDTIRREYLSGIYDALSRGDREGSSVGSRVILPSSFTGGPRYMYSHYLDALAICRVLGNPQFFITFTCNVRWPEIKRYMLSYPNLTANDRADVISRVYQQKVVLFIKYLRKQKPFGDVTGVLYTIEFQKRGLPHCHTLLWLDKTSKLKDAQEVDRYISAEVPNPIVDPHGHRVVAELMFHGPCGSVKPDAPCMQDGRCSKKFPKRFNTTSFFDKDGHIHYRRREQDTTVTKQSIKLDNTYVVPYNRELCLAFYAHINVEYCGWSMLIKYLFKYISKGTDRVVARLTKPVGDSAQVEPSVQNIDEIQTFIDGRYICPHEASWRILNYNIHYREPAVQILSVHLQDMQTLRFKSKDDLSSVVSDPFRKKTTLTEWLTYNSAYADGHQITYLQFPGHFVWRSDSKCWTPRKNKNKTSIGRIAYVHPASGELFYLRLLLCHQKGCACFIDIRTVNKKIYSTYRAACNVLGLLGDDKEWEIAMKEASFSSTSKELRNLFVQIIIYCDVSDPAKIWAYHWQAMSDDIHIRISKTLALSQIHINSEDMQNYVLYELEIMFNTYGKSLVDYGLPMPPAHLLNNLRNRLLMEETSYDRDLLKKEAAESIPQLNHAQRKIYDLIMQSSLQRTQQLLFVYGHGGTGKTFLWKTIIGSLRSQGKIVLAVASSGIASLLLPSGRTAHSRFKLPLDITNESLCKITKNTHMANLLKETELIVWDEAPMNDRLCFETLDRTLKDILDNPNVLFGGKSMVLGGDFRQTLPIKKNASKPEIIGCSISESHLWPHFRLCTLTENMRLSRPDMVDSDRKKVQTFASWLLAVGNGHIGRPSTADDTLWVDIPEELCLRDDADALQNLITFIYDDDTLKTPTAEKLQNKAIICPRNDTADLINTHVLQLLSTETTTYISSDTATPTGNDGGETELLYPTEYLNSLNFSGFPAHNLDLKIGTPVMLLRNINVTGGLCNGTRMIIKQLLSKVIEVQIITGTRIGERVFLHHIPLTRKEPNLPFILKRTQFPIKLCYAMTINKSQGQSLNKIGIFLPDSIFGHGQLYVALSRATSPDGIKVLIKSQDGQPWNSTKNIVYADFLSKITTATEQL